MQITKGISFRMENYDANMNLIESFPIVYRYSVKT